MTDRTKFEQMLDYLLSEDQEKAREVFHQLVVEKSREIYENILSEELADDEEEVEENFGFAEAGDDDVPGDDEEEVPGEIGGDATDDFIGDVEPGAEDEMGAEGDIEDRVVDLEDALDDLRAEFERLMADEESEPEHDDMFGGDDTEGASSDEEGAADELNFDDEDDTETKEEFFREYVEKVTAPKMGDDGANTQSIVAKKNDMGGTTANLRGGEAKGEGTKGGLLNPSTKEDDAGNVNVPGAKKAATLSKVSAPKGGDNGLNTKSMLGAK